VAVVGASADTEADNAAFRVKQGLHFPLLSDPRGEAISALGIRSERGLAKRTTYLIDGGGTLRRIWENVQIDGHADEVLEAARALGD
jgi:peroxiredoxin Q/BCP